MPLIAIIIPCFNEEKRLATAEIAHFLRSHSNYHFVFVNDGSTDNTANILHALRAGNMQQVTNITLQANRGKAIAIREGFLLIVPQERYAFVGYWDADLSTGLNELLRISEIVIERRLEFAFGSRMKKLNATIQRSGFRHFAGRITTTIIDSCFKLGIYDTQCGAKLFSAGIAEIISREAFVTDWLFDIEIFLRIEENCPGATGDEIPLLSWTSHQGSKISILNTPGLMVEFIKLIRRYKKGEK